MLDDVVMHRGNVRRIIPWEARLPRGGGGRRAGGCCGSANPPPPYQPYLTGVSSTFDHRIKYFCGAQVWGGDCASEDPQKQTTLLYCAQCGYYTCVPCYTTCAHCTWTTLHALDLACEDERLMASWDRLDDCSLRDFIRRVAQGAQ